MNSILLRDKKTIWHPFTQEKTAPPPLVIKRAQGCYLYDETGKAYLDLISSWWVNLHGHSHPTIAHAIYQQALSLAHVIFAGVTHEPALRLCEQLQALLPKELSRFFFSDDGSTAVECALKMAYQYWWNQKKFQKTIFLGLEGGYHGDTWGAMSVGVSSGFHAPFSSLCFQVETVPFPETWEGDEAIDEKEKKALSALETYLAAHAHHVAAFILEPMVQGASGMRMCRPTFVEALVHLVKQNDILIIFDEVMTGFYRTGTCFALEQTKVVPDFICLSKGLTGGFLPLALTVTREEIYENFLGDHFSTAFAHGHSYTGNPLGCAAALASLSLLKEPSTLQAIREIHLAHQRGLLSLSQFPFIHKVRLCGTIAAFDIKGDYPFEITPFLKSTFLKRGLFLRPLGRTVYLMPPYAMTPQELDEVYDTLACVIKELWESL